MTAFVKENFEYHGGYLNYRVSDDYKVHPKFVARFKYSAKDKPAFITFLKKNFTVEEYFDRIGNGCTGESPVGILESKGYVSTTVKKILRDQGYQPTLEGKKQYLQEGQINRRRENNNG